jgi:uncharacterized protein (DUF1786 family)
MSRFLIVDVGAGTLDLLYYDSGLGIQYKGVVKSPVLQLAEKAAQSAGPLLLSGREMGGGSLSQILREKAKSTEVIMTRSASATVHHDLERIRSWGIRIVEDEEVTILEKEKKYLALTLGDIQPERIEGLVKGMGIPYAFDIVGICVQDHGVPPKGVSHLDFRHNIFEAILREKPFPHRLLYEGDRIPPHFSRFRALAKDAQSLPTDELYFMDSGMAAILGGSMDTRIPKDSPVVLLDVATSHTVGATMVGDELAGFFEYHTHGLTMARLEALVVDLADGKLTHRQILQEGGHGAFLRKAIGFDKVEVILSTGPRRQLFEKTRLPMTLGAPLGDNMMTGTAGVLEAIRRRKGLAPIPWG